MPVPDPNTYPGLQMAFELAAHGKSDREVARTLSAQGYRTSGPRGGNPFSASSIRGMLTNRFYLGYLPDGKGGWIKGKHDALIDPALWDQVQEARRRRRTFATASCPNGKGVNSLTGLAHCWHCGGRIHTQYMYKGEPRMGCYTRQKGWGCPQKSANLSVYETQVFAYLSSFHIPADYQQHILEAHRKLENAYDQTEEQRTKLDRQLRRAKDLYELGDHTRAEYLARRDALRRRLGS